MGRSDDMIILKGVNIYPGQIDEVLSQIPGTGCEYQLHLSRTDDGKETMTIKVEAGNQASISDTDDIRGRIRQAVRAKIMVSCDAQVIPYGELPRVPGKARRIFDNRG
ncbi:MAG: hypothetical protein U5K27_17780 [Desulfotignum sp.]|nr:hypothetical protein [Desulfotignum sp.]